MDSYGAYENPFGIRVSRTVIYFWRPPDLDGPAHTTATLSSGDCEHIQKCVGEGAIGGYLRLRSMGRKTYMSKFQEYVQLLEAPIHAKFPGLASDRYVCHVGPAGSGPGPGKY